MQRWFVSLAAAGVLASAASAQVQIQIQVDPKPGAQVQGNVQIKQAQVIQGQAAQIIQGKAVLMAPGMNNQTKLTQADAIFVGRVIAIEPMDVEAESVAGPKLTYRVAVVQVSESIYGLKKDAQQVRLGFLTQREQGGGFQAFPAPGQPGILPPNGLRRPFQPNFQMQLQVGQDGMFAVNKHHKENFYLAPQFSGFITREGNQSFDAEVKTAKQLAKVMGSPIAALKADDKQDRYLAAAILVTKYRNVANPTGQAMKQEPIDAEESKLILQAIAGGDWTPGRFNATIPTPFELFNQLGISQNDGYKAVNGPQQATSQAMQKWLDENNGKYRINRQIANPSAKGPSVGIQPQPAPLNVPPGIRALPPVRVQPLPAPVPPVPEK